MNDSYSTLFSALSKCIDEFIQAVKSKKSTLMTTEEWTVKDELCHIVFWHETYAENYRALANNEEPSLPQDMSSINIAGVMWLRRYSKKELLHRLQDAHESLHNSIVVKKIPQMTYSKGGRIYSTDDFLSMIARHIQTHMTRVNRAQ